METPGSVRVESASRESGFELDGDSYLPGHVANFMLDRADRERRDLSPMKLLKLVYIGYGWALAVLGGRKLFHEPILAWPHGPVVRSLYDEFKHYGRNPIGERSVEFDIDSFDLYTPRVPGDDKDANLVLGKVWDVYKSFSAASLRSLTHRQDTPWRDVYRQGRRDTPIPDDLIRDHFTTKINQYLDNAD